MDRRKFIKTSCAVCGVAAVGAAFLDSCKKKDTKPSVNFNIDLTSSANTALNTVGGSVIQNNVIVIRTAAAVSSSSFSALASICTHAGCTVGYNTTSNTVVCPCHGGVYTTSGSVQAGPPPSPLTKYATTLSGNTLNIAS